jgi:hypothetical protein
MCIVRVRLADAVTSASSHMVAHGGCGRFRATGRLLSGWCRRFAWRWRNWWWGVINRCGRGSGRGHSSWGSSSMRAGNVW